MANAPTNDSQNKDGKNAEAANKAAADDSQARIKDLQAKLEAAEKARDEATASAEAANKAAADAESHAASPSKGGFDKKAIKADYENGLNHYALAKKYVGFETEEAVDKIREVLGR